MAKSATDNEYLIGTSLFYSAIRLHEIFKALACNMYRTLVLFNAIVCTCYMHKDGQKLACFVLNQTQTWITVTDIKSMLAHYFIGPSSVLSQPWSHDLQSSFKGTRCIVVLMFSVFTSSASLFNTYKLKNQCGDSLEVKNPIDRIILYPGLVWVVSLKRHVALLVSGLQPIKKKLPTCAFKQLFIFNNLIDSLW